MQNHPAARAGAVNRPIMLKRGMYATLDEWFMAAEYIMAEGNSQVILCERGIRGIGEHTRNLLDLATVPSVHREPTCLSSSTPATPPAAGTWWRPWPGPRWPPGPTAP